ncbi:MAG: M28 family peptidase [Chloroflexota bacterium]|nr:M28 family peptidase [Chloroflexota bacterium]
MRRLIFIILIFSLFMPVSAAASPIRTARAVDQQDAGMDFPAVDPNYIYDQLFYTVTHFQRRESGYHQNVPVSVSGHDAFAAYWSQEMARDLQGFGPQVRRDFFATPGWLRRTPTVPAFNVEVSVPGVVHPEQAVVIGCHYDGEASSTQSANDDGSGCSIELGVARAMASYWRAHHVYPARTLRFVIFDAEEQGIYGSFHYLDSTINGDISNITAMFNEEQNGIAYPLRFLGQLDNPPLYFRILLSPVGNDDYYPKQADLSPQRAARITRFQYLQWQAVIAAFAKFRALGYQMLSYHNAKKQDVLQPIFTPDQLQDIHMMNDNSGGSDQIPFTLAGLACSTFIGDFSYYDPYPPIWAYPYDQSNDTIQLMNTFADGSSHKSNALMLALGLPGMLTTWMLNQPDILGLATLDRNPVAAISDVGQTKVGASVSLDAQASFDPQSSSTPLSYAWNFGDGTTASGIRVQHTYTTAGSYHLILTVTSPAGTRRVSKTITVVAHPTIYSDFYRNYYGQGFGQQDGRPPANPVVTLPKPDDSLSDRVALAPPASTVSSVLKLSAPAPSYTGTIIGIALAVLLVVVIAGVALQVRRRARHVS